MKTAQEMTYDFMLALASTINSDEVFHLIEDEPDVADNVADTTLAMAQALTRKYLESL